MDMDSFARYSDSRVETGVFSGITIDHKVQNFSSIKWRKL